jgi:hypothetical protein
VASSSGAVHGPSAQPKRTKMGWAGRYTGRCRSCDGCRAPDRQTRDLLVDSSEPGDGGFAGRWTIVKARDLSDATRPTLSIPLRDFAMALPRICRSGPPCGKTGLTTTRPTNEGGPSPLHRRAARVLRPHGATGSNQVDRATLSPLSDRVNTPEGGTDRPAGPGRPSAPGRGGRHRRARRRPRHRAGSGANSPG